MELPTTSPPFRREGFPAGPTYELQVNGQVLVYANRILEFFRADIVSDGAWRWHVDHVAVEVKPKRDGNYVLAVGMARDGDVWSPAKLGIPADRLDDVTTFFEILKGERSPQPEVEPPFSS